MNALGIEIREGRRQKAIDSLAFKATRRRPTLAQRIKALLGIR